jgi:hypothetical protein
VISAWAHTIDGDLVLLDRVRARLGEEQHFAQALPLVNAGASTFCSSRSRSTR